MDAGYPCDTSGVRRLENVAGEMHLGFTHQVHHANLNCMPMLFTRA